MTTRTGIPLMRDDANSVSHDLARAYHDEREVPDTDEERRSFYAIRACRYPAATLTLFLDWCDRIA